VRKSVVRGTFAGTALWLVLAAGVSNAQQANPATSGLSGLVVDTLDGPVAYAQISVVNGREGVTANEDGKFLLLGLRAGTVLIAVRRIGYDPVYFDVEIPASMTVGVRVRMHATARELNTVAVDEVRDPLKRVGFYDRMAAGNGHFISPAMLAKMRPTRATDAFMSIPNLVVDRRGGKSRIMTSNYRCEYAMVIDKVGVGQPGSRIRTTSPDDLVSASDLYAVEVYPRNLGLPAQFAGMSQDDGCGTVVIWTKGMIAR
jgi:hypothetical protein